MKRLTTNKDVSDIEGMYELAHNSCYIDKDGNVRYRDFETDVDARTLIRGLLKKYADGDDVFISDDDFDCQMMEALQYGTDTREGLIALFYRNLWAMAELREKLKHYEDAEDQGLLLRTKCRLGDIVYALWSVPTKSKYVVYPAEVKGINLLSTNARKMLMYKLEPVAFRGRYNKYYDDDFGKLVFMTEEEAEKALEQMKAGE